MTTIEEYPGDAQNITGNTATTDLCDSNPDFPIICSFISTFGETIDLKLNIENLKESIENQEALSDDLIELHVKLLKKIRRYLNRDQWERALMRFAYDYSPEAGYELENAGYLKTRTSIKLELLGRLLDAQFDCDPKFKASVNSLEADKLRILPTGRDIRGNTYWHCQDDEGNFRVYREEPLDYRAWEPVCRNPDDLKALLSELDQSKSTKVKGEPLSEPYNPYPEIFSELFIKNETSVVNQPVKDTTLPVKTARSRSRKSRPLYTLKEVDENMTPKPQSLKINLTRVELPLSEDNRPRSISPNGNTSVESQVKHTIESILNKVASSFDFIFRRSSPDTTQNMGSNHVIREKKQARPRKKRERPQAEELPRRSSSRIQLLQQKKLEEEEETRKKQMLQSKVEPKPNLNDGDSRDSVASEKKQKSKQKRDRQRWRDGKGRKKMSWDKDDSDLSGTSSLTESDDESFVQAIDEANNDGNDDEFACEEEESCDIPVIIKRARTARQIIGAEPEGDLNNTSIIDEDKPCGRCDKSNDPESILLCDMCDGGHHTMCCLPPLMYVPDGDWFCPSCEHKVLIEKLTELLNSVEAILAIRERERFKRQKLRQNKPKSIETTEQVKEEQVTNIRKRDNFLNELSEPIAVQALDEELRNSSDEALPASYKERAYPQSKKRKTKKIRKRSRRLTDSEDDEISYKPKKRSKPTRLRYSSESETEDEQYTNSSEGIEESDDSDQPKARRARACVSYNFDEYDELIKSAICADSEVIDAGLTDHEEEPEPQVCNQGRGKDMAVIEALAYQQENQLTGTEEPSLPEANVTHQEKPVARKKRGRKLNDLDADSEIDIATSDESFQAPSDEEEATEEEEEEDVTEVSSDEETSIDEIVQVAYRYKKKKSRRSYSSDEEDDYPRKRRAATRQVSYRESSNDENSPRGPSPTHPPFYEDDEVRPPSSFAG